MVGGVMKKNLAGEGRLVFASSRSTNGRNYLKRV